MKPDVQAARIAIDAHPNDTTHRQDLARTLMETAWFDPAATWKAKYEEAAAILESLLTIEPDNVVALVNLGVALSDQGFHARTLEYYRRAESLDWVDGNLEFNIGVALVNLKDDDSGILSKPGSRSVSGSHFIRGGACVEPLGRPSLGQAPRIPAGRMPK